MDLPRLSEMEAVILDLLANEPKGMFGLQLVRASERVKRGSVYVLLNRMSEKGYVDSVREDRGAEGGLPRRVFSITGYGAKALQAHRAWERAAKDAFGEAWAT